MIIALHYASSEKGQTWWQIIFWNINVFQNFDISWFCSLVYSSIMDDIKTIMDMIRKNDWRTIMWLYVFARTLYDIIWVLKNIIKCATTYMWFYTWFGTTIVYLVLQMVIPQVTMDTSLKSKELDDWGFSISGNHHIIIWLVVNHGILNDFPIHTGNGIIIPTDFHFIIFSEGLKPPTSYGVSKSSWYTVL